MALAFSHQNTKTVGKKTAAPALDLMKVARNGMERSPSAVGAKSGKSIDPLPREIQEKVALVYGAGQYSQTATVCAKLLNAYKTSPYLWTTLGQCHEQRNALNESLTCLNRARELDPNNVTATSGMAQVYRRLGRMLEAEQYFREALRIEPDNVITLNNFGGLLNGLGRSDEAAQLFETAMALAPDNGTLFYNCANAKRQLGQSAQAMELYARAVESAPELTEARFNYGQMLVTEQKFEAAVEQFTEILKHDPSHDPARAFKMHMQAMLGDFSWTDEYNAHRRQLGLTGAAVSPWATLALEDNPDILRLRTQAYASSQFVDMRAETPMRTPPPTRPKRLKIGYFSADFHSHATMHLMAGVLRNHDREQFEIHAFSYGEPRQDSQREATIASVDHFHDVSALSDRALVEQAQSANLDIAIDLKGYTGFNRSTIFGNRLAPLHISYLGYPGTMGSPVFDYIITDSVVSPQGSERHFEEHLIRLPHSYQCNDNMRPISSRQFTRTDCGLPEEGFVFCCFNNSYKITPREFDIWMRLLSQTEGSVLWLLSAGAAEEANLRREAQARDVSPHRLIFAGRMPHDEHLARQEVADLFLDTFSVNAHTTCSDALWAGLPVLTLPGAQFAARVSASLLSALNMPELIASSEQQYEEIALRYAQNPEALLSLKSKLEMNRSLAALYDTAGFTQDLERAFDAAYMRWMEGLEPEHLTLTA